LPLTAFFTRTNLFPQTVMLRTLSLSFEHPFFSKLRFPFAPPVDVKGTARLRASFFPLNDFRFRFLLTPFALELVAQFSKTRKVFLMLQSGSFHINCFVLCFPSGESSCFFFCLCDDSPFEPRSLPPWGLAGVVRAGSIPPFFFRADTRT